MNYSRRSVLDHLKVLIDNEFVIINEKNKFNRKSYRCKCSEIDINNLEIPKTKRERLKIIRDEQRKEQLKEQKKIDRSINIRIKNRHEFKKRRKGLSTNQFDVYKNLKDGVSDHITIIRENLPEEVKNNILSIHSIILSLEYKGYIKRYRGRLYKLKENDEVYIL
jgi:hypothetical protein